jgi:hypothetical protein
MEFIMLLQTAGDYKLFSWGILQQPEVCTKRHEGGSFSANNEAGKLGGETYRTQRSHKRVLASLEEGNWIRK